MASARRVRVLHVVTRMNIGGPARHLITLLPLLEERGFDTLLVYGTSQPGEGELEPPGTPSARLPGLRRPLRPAADARSLADLARIMGRHRPHLVHTHMAKAGAIGRLVARRRGIPTVHTFHGHVLEGYFGSAASRVYVTTERRLARRTDALVAVSDAVRDDLLRLGIGDARTWRVIPLGFDLEPLTSGDVDRASARRALGVMTTGPVVGIVGRLAPIKDHGLFLESARRVLEWRPDATFVVAGDGELRRSLTAEAARTLGDRVRFTGWVESLPRLYAALDVVVSSSRNEGTPVALIEAAGAGLPVVATDVGGVPDVVVDGETGFLVPPGDAGALAGRISDLLQDPTLGRRMGDEARRRAKTVFSPAGMADRTSDLYREVLDRRP